MRKKLLESLFCEMINYQEYHQLIFLCKFCVDHLVQNELSPINIFMQICVLHLVQNELSTINIFMVKTF